MTLKKTTLAMITLTCVQSLYAAECPRLTYNDLEKGTINYPAIQPGPIPVYFVKKSFLEQNQMVIPENLIDYPTFEGNMTSDINLTSVIWNSETKQITCGYEAYDTYDNDDSYYAVDLVLATQNIPDPLTQAPSRMNNDKFIWTYTHFSKDDYHYIGSGCSYMGTPIPAASCTWDNPK